MSVPNHQIDSITEEDVSTISYFLQDSKLHLAINRFLIEDWPNPPVQKALYNAAIRASLSNPQTTCLKVVNDTSKEPVAYLFYTKQKQPSGKQEVPAGVTPEVFWAVTNAFQELYRRQGIGTWLLQMAQDYAAEEKLPFRIIAEPNHHDFFVNRGFRDIKHVDIDLTRWAAPLSGYGMFRMSSMVATGFMIE
ncbi:hypothetical protein F4803DRAFT_566414 [Xylaria telfairii]|nr:hypothetical protein F4803DRAFT_566414 [Xylaria telfairii]